MYIEPELIKVCGKYSQGRINNNNIEEFLNNNGVWYTLEGIKEDMEYEHLEDVMSDTFFIIVKDKMKFCGIDQIIEDASMYDSNE